LRVTQKSGGKVAEKNASRRVCFGRRNQVLHANPKRSPFQISGMCDFGFLADITGQLNELSSRLQYKVRTSLFMLFDCAKGSEETGVMETVVEE
jgi:hypothetical protein